MASKAQAIQNYILAKDGNRPFLLNHAFAEDATLAMELQTQAIAFPSALSGRDAIADVLVRQFNQKFENIYTLCVGDPNEVQKENYRCPWLVVMTGKQDDSLRIGCGVYDWRFRATDNRVRALTITIDMMETAPATSTTDVMTWVSGLPYPWCELSAAADKAPDVAAVRRVLGHLQGMD